MGHYSSWPLRKRSLLPTGSPFSWSTHERILYIQALSVLLVLGANVVLLVFDGWPFVETSSEEALRATRLVFGVVLALWVVLYFSTWRWLTPRERTFSWLLLTTVLFCVWTTSMISYMMGLFTAPSALVLLWTALVGMVLLRPLLLWTGVVTQCASLLAIHWLSRYGVLPFGPVVDGWLPAVDSAPELVRRGVATGLLFVPLLFVGTRLVEPWRLEDRSLQRAAQLDSLTGTYTRSFARALMREALAKAKANSSPASLLILDLDRFKEINDTYGHSVGDEVLKATTKTVAGTLRSADILGRFGGEEFVLLLPGADLERATCVAERFRSAVETLRVAGTGGLEVTLSVGIAGYDEHGRDIDSLLEAADEALYRAKTEGRNQVRTAQAGPNEQAIASPPARRPRAS